MRFTLRTCGRIVRRIPVVCCAIIALSLTAASQEATVSSAFSIARLKYTGGGDWYNDPSEEVNLLVYVQKQAGIDVDAHYHFVQIMDENFFSCPFIYMTGHGNISFSEPEVKRLRTYLENGGFLYADDDYGMDKAFRREIKKVFPDQELTELPYSHGLYHCVYDFPHGPPKIHEHNGKPAQGFGLFHDGRLVVYYTYETNPSDGWADPEIHKDPEEKRQQAFHFGTNIVIWALTH